MILVSSGSGDYISRKAALSEQNKSMNLAEMRERLKRIPAADVRPVVRGKWKIQKASIHPYGNDVCCSECGFTMGSSFGYRFCPNCGADMREES